VRERDRERHVLSVSLQAKPIIMPWSPARRGRTLHLAGAARASYDLFTPMAMSPDCSLIEERTPHVSQSKPILESL